VQKTTILLIMLVLASFASALTLDEAKQMALSKNSKYLAQKDAYESAKWSKQQALGGLLPSLSLSGTYVYLDPAVSITTGMGSTTLNHDSRSAALTLSQPLFMGGKLWQAYKINGITETMSRLALENMRLSIIREAESKYLAVLQLQELKAISEKDLASSKNTLAIAKVRFDNGTMSSPDYLKIQAKAANKEVALIQSDAALELAKQDLLNTLGNSELSELTPIVLDSEEARLMRLSLYTAEQTNAFTGKAILLSKEHNLALQTAKASTQLSKKAYNIATGSFLPTVLLSASRSYKENGIDRYQFEGTNTLALTASVPLLPLWNTYSGSRKAWYDYQKSEADFQTAADGINLGVKASSLNLISSARQVSAARIALQYTELTYQQLMERFRNNMLSTTDILDAEVMLQAAQVSLTNAVYSYLKARSSLLQALGTDDINTINSLME
jgi:outer membrane protein